LIIAALCWALSEIIELALGGRTQMSLFLTAAFHLLMVFGIWGAFIGQGERRGQPSMVAALLVSIGYLVMIYPPLKVGIDPKLTLHGFMDAYPAFKAAGLAAVFGKSLFGLAILRSGAYPVWTGIVLLIGPLLFAGLMLAGGPDRVAIITNLCVAAALLAIGLRAMRLPARQA
jgi:hypothetical protein